MAINPLQAPINYMGMIPQVDLGEQFASFGQALAKRQERIQKQELQQQYSQDLQNALANPTQKTWSEMVAKYPQQREAFEAVRKGYGEQRLENEFNQGFAVSLALENQNPDVAKAELQKIIEARKNSNEPTQIYQQVYDAIEAGNITGAQAGVNMALTVADPERYQKAVEAQIKAKQAPSMVSESAAKADEAVAAATIAKANATNATENARADAQLKAANAQKAKVEADFSTQQELAKLALNKANIANLNSQISDRAQQRQIDRQRLALETTAKLQEIQAKGMEIPESAQKLVNESATKASANKLAAEQQLQLAADLEKLGGGYGAFGSASEFIKKSFGTQDAMTQLRADYTRLRNSGATKYMPPGPATDKDVQLVLEGFLPANASAKQLASFLRGMAKISDMDAALENAKTDWLTNNKGQLGRARTSFIAGDLAVKPGESFTDFSTRAAKAVAEKYKTPAQRIEEARVNSAALIPTRDVTPTTARPVSSIRAQADAILSGGQ